MEGKINIIKIVKENGEEIDVNLILDIHNRCIEKTNIKKEIYFELFNKKSLFAFDIGALNLILYSDNTCYYCYNCIFGYNIDTNGNIAIFCNSIDYIISNTCNNYDKLKINKFQIDFEIPKYIRENYIDYNIDFNYNSNIRVSLKRINRSKKPCLLILTIYSHNQTSANNLSNLAYKIYELLMLYFGTGLKIINRKLYSKNIIMDLYSSIVDKYSCGVKNSVSFSNLVMVDKNSLNKDIIKKYVDFDKDTLLLNAVYLTIINTDTYREIKINMILQCIEGFYKSVYGKIKSYNLRGILKEVFLRNSYCKKILSNLDKRIIITKEGYKESIFIYKAKNHRNYFSHLNINERKNVFEKNQINYAYWKLVLAYRLLVIEYLGVKYDRNLLNEIINDINGFKKRHKIRMSI